MAQTTRHFLIELSGTFASETNESDIALSVDVLDTASGDYSGAQFRDFQGTDGCRVHEVEDEATALANVLQTLPLLHTDGRDDLRRELAFALLAVTESDPATLEWLAAVCIARAAELH